MTKQKVIIIGAGLAGSLLSTYLAKRGIETLVFEARPDMRRAEVSAGRSINLALSNRGIAALREVGMDEFMLREAVPMYGRLIHPVEGVLKFLPYSGREGEFINSVSRTGLNIALINEADKYPESTFLFNRKCVDFDCRTGAVLIEDAETGEQTSVEGATVIATDGAGSAVRRAMMNKHGCVERFDYSQEFLEHGYKELSIPPKSEFAGTLPELSDKASGEFLLEKNALHIWARHEFLMIALPNFDGSFTCTLFLAFEGEESFAAIETGSWGKEIGIVSDSEHAEHKSSARKSQVSSLLTNVRYTDEAGQSLIRFFEKHFPDALPLMPNLTEEFFTNPTGNLGTIKCFPWNVGGKSLLLGDSAHALVPFYGQGMNAAFEDCRLLDKLIDRHASNWEKIFEEYGKERKINTDAIADLAVENFYEMRDRVADPVFQKKRELETRLEHEFPEYFSKYSLVTFREDIPYSAAQKLGNAQDKLLMEICEKTKNPGELDLRAVLQKINSIESGLKH